MTYQPHQSEDVSLKTSDDIERDGFGPRTPLQWPANSADNEEARLGYTFKGGVKTYCCYGMYCDVGHSIDCKHRAAISAATGQEGKTQ